MRRLLLTLAFIALPALSACKGPCRELSEKLCDCEVNTYDRNNCDQRAGDQEGRVNPTSDQEAVCESLLKTCDCKKVDTAEGKQACGLAR